MPMPVSRTSNTASRRSSRADTTTSPRSVNLSAFDTRLRRICASLPWSVSNSDSRAPARRSAARRSSRAGERAQLPRSAANSSPTANRSARSRLLPASILDRSSMSLTSSDSSSAELRMKPSCFSCSSVSGPSVRVEQQPRQPEDRVERRAELVADVGDQAPLDLARAAQGVGLFGELGMRREHALVRFIELLDRPRSAACWCWRAASSAAISRDSAPALR